MVDQLGWVSSMAVASAAVLLGVAWFCHLFGRVFARRTARLDRSAVPDLLGRSFARLAGAFLVIGCLARGIAAGRVPWGNMYEFAITGATALVIAYVIIERRRPELRLGVVVPAVAVIILGLAVILYVPIAPLVPALRSYWLVLHVLAAALSGACFILAGVISARYLIDTRRGRPADSGTPAALDRLAFRLVAFAFPIWTFGALIAGPIWAEYAWGRYWGWDPKEVWALVTWIVFAAYLHARATAGWRGRRAAVLAIVGAVSFVFNYIGVNLFFAGLHSYAGI